MPDSPARSTARAADRSHNRAAMTSLHRLGPIYLQPGISRWNTVTLLYAAVFSICLQVFVSFGQPYILAVNLALPEDQQGSVVGNLNVLQELVILGLIGPLGALSDLIGRRTIFVGGFLMLGLGYALYPFADSVGMLMAFRAVFAVGCAAVAGMLATVVTDYPQERSRGKLVSLTGVLNGVGLGVIMALVFSRLPAWYLSMGNSELAAGRYTYLTVAVVCVITALVVRAGLRAGTTTPKKHKRSFTSLLREGIAAARNPRISLCYGSAFAARGDAVIIGNFLSLWVVQASQAEGHSSGDALAVAGRLFAITLISALLWAPVMGFLIDRINRVSALAVAMLLAALGYLGIGLIKDPLSDATIPLLVLLGIGQISAMLGSQTLIGQEADPEIRGSVLGVFGLFGALGILISSWLGGQLFDRWMPAGPFVMMGVANACILCWAVIVRIFAGNTVAPRSTGMT